MKRGFTLIELLVVIAIISLLSSVVLASVGEAKMKAKQTAHRQYIGQVVKAIELYRLDKGELPQSGNGVIHIQTLINNYLSTYIKYQETSPTSSATVYAGPDIRNAWSFDCGHLFIERDEYLIYYKIDSDLNYPKFHNAITSNPIFSCANSERY